MNFHMENEADGGQHNAVQEGQPQPRQPELTRISAKEFGAKFKSKRECYNFLAGELDIYLPPYGKLRTMPCLTAFFVQIT